MVFKEFVWEVLGPCCNCISVGWEALSCLNLVRVAGNGASNCVLVVPDERLEVVSPPKPQSVWPVCSVLRELICVTTMLNEYSSLSL